MRNIILAIGVGLAIIFGAIGIYAIYQMRIVEPGQLSPSPLPSPTEKFPSSQEGSALGSKTPSIQPVAGTNTVPIPNIGIIVISPADGEIISSPVKVVGRTNFFAEDLAIYIKDSNGSILGLGLATACADIDTCNFEASVVFSKSQTTHGTVEIFVTSTSDNSQTTSQTVPVTFK